MAAIDTLRHGPARPEPQDAPADETLVALAAAGDREAFGTLVQRHQRPLIGFLFRMTGNRDAAADLAQDVFIKVYQSLGSFDPTYRFTTWLYRIASNWAIDHLRRRQPRTCPIGPAGDDDQPPPPEVAGTDPSPDDVLRLRELEARLEDAIEGLPPAYRQLILLRHRQHLRYDEIARATRLPIGTVKNRIFRAREMLRTKLSDLLDAEA